MDSGPPLTGQPPHSDVESDRLDSWKEIGAFLRRDVRTAQRWERTERLPIHRKANAKRGSVFAFRSEIDVWWRHRYPLFPRGDLEKSAKVLEQPAPARSSVHIHYFIYSAFALAAVLVLAAGRLHFSDHAKQTITHARSRFTIVVLPFENVSSSSIDRYLAEGMTKEVIAELEKNSDFRVVPVEAVRRSGPTVQSPLQIAKEYHADAWIEGVITPSGDSIQITTQLIDASTGRRIFTDNFERSSQATLSHGSDIARLISDSVRSSLLPHRVAQ